MSSFRPYLIAPKLIEQPTWGGSYIVAFKNWQDRGNLGKKKIGQSFELSSGSILVPDITDSASQDFGPEGATGASVKTIALQQFIDGDPAGVLGKQVASVTHTMPLLIKFTQALGNSFQIHLKDGVQHPKWKSKPESWYYLEPGLITCGVKPTTDWGQYQKAVTELNDNILAIAGEVQSGALPYATGKERIQSLVRQYDPWQYVNIVEAPKKALIDLSACGIHHSWEEDAEKLPLGNVLYEVQLDVADPVATIRNFDKGKMSEDGAVRPLQIEDYFALIDRTAEANDPKTHMRKSSVVSSSEEYCYERLMQTKYYTLDLVKLMRENASFTGKIDHYRHMFVRTGSLTVRTDGGSLRLTQGHSAFIPAGAGAYTLQSTAEKAVALVSY